MKRLLSILFIIGLIFGQEKIDLKKNNISIGMWDEKTGFSHISYTYDIHQTENRSFFLGGGTSILGWTGTMGWQQYFYKSKFLVSSVITAQRVDNFMWTGFMPTASILMKYQLFKKAQVKLGLVALSLGGSPHDSKALSEIFPFIALNWNY